MRDLHDTLINMGFKIGIPLLLFTLVMGIIIIFHEFWIGLITIFYSAILLFFGIASYMFYKRDKKSFLKAHIRIIVWRDFAFLLSMIFLILAIIIGYQNRRIGI